mgnify:CR=1 FL=1
MAKPSAPLLESIYKDTFPDVARLVKRLGGDLPTAQDIFHDALIIYMEKYRSNSLNIKSSPKAYLIGIVKVLWLKQFKNNHVLQLTSFEEHLAIPEDFYLPQDEWTTQLFDHLKATGQKCMQLLQAFYYNDWSVQKITESFRYKTRHSATVQKYKCLEKLREQVKQSTFYEEVIA